VGAEFGVVGEVQLDVHGHSPLRLTVNSVLQKQAGTER
jgi:hypothetical protein